MTSTLDLVLKTRILYMYTFKEKISKGTLPIDNLFFFNYPILHLNLMSVFYEVIKRKSEH